MGPKLAEIGPKVAEVGPKLAQGGPSWTQVGPKLAPSWLQERKKPEPNEQRSGRDEQRDENCDFNLQVGVQEVIVLDAKWCGSIFKNVFPAKAGITFSKNRKKNACSRKLDKETISWWM